MKYNITMLGFLTILTSCSYSINMVHSEGHGTDMIDEAQTPTADITIPFMPVKP